MSVLKSFNRFWGILRAPGVSKDVLGEFRGFKGRFWRFQGTKEI